MTTQEALQVLIAHNEWRRGDSPSQVSTQYQDPRIVGEAIDTVVAALQNIIPAAEDAIDRWDSPSWKDQPATAKYIDALRRAVRDGMGRQEMDLIRHLERQMRWSEATFGPGERTSGVVDHIRKELHEIEAAPNDITEWIDVVILALDGAWRAGHSPQQIAQALQVKQTKNEGRTWPDWRTAEPGKAIEHVRTEGK